MCTRWVGLLRVEGGVMEGKGLTEGGEHGMGGIVEYFMIFFRGGAGGCQENKKRGVLMEIEEAGRRLVRLQER